MQAMGPRGEKSDEQLAVQAARGDREAVSVLVRRFSGPLYGFIQRYQPHGGDSEDLLQETWIRALRNLDRFDPGRRFSTWLFQIALNQCRDHARRRAVRARAWTVLAHEPVDRSTTSVEEVVNARRSMQAILDLPVAQKEALLLRYYHGFSEAEAAEILGCPRGTVKSRLHKAVRAVREALADEKTADPGP